LIDGILFRRDGISADFFDAAEMPFSLDYFRLSLMPMLMWGHDLRRFR